MNHFDPSAQIHADVIKNAEAYHAPIKPHCASHGLNEITDRDWILLSRWLSTLDDIATHTDSMLNLVSIGMSTSDAIADIENMGDLPLIEVVRQLDRVYKQVHRGDYVGSITPMQIDDHHYVFDCHTPYPRDYMYGVIYGFTERFLSPDYVFTLQIDDDTVEEGDIMRLRLTWETPAA